MYVLLRSHNDYNQHGEYFVAVWPIKPTAEQILSIVIKRLPLFRLSDAEHVLSGGGRRNCEDVWFTLEKVKTGEGR